MHKRLTLTALFIVFTLFFSQSALAAISYVKNVGTAADKTTSTSIQVTVGAAGVASGNTLIVSFAGDFTAGDELIVPTCSDSQGNSYNTDIDQYYSGQSIRTAICSAYITTALTSGDTITVIHASMTPKAMSVNEFSGLLSFGALDQTQSAVNTSTTPTSGSTAMTTQADELVFGAVGMEGPSGDTFTQGAGFSLTGRIGTTGASAASNRTINPEYKIVAATGTYLADGTNSNSRPWAAAVATYRDAAGPPFTLIADGISPADKEVYPNSTNKAVNSFSLSANSGTDTLMALTVTFSGTNVNDVAASGVKIYRDVNEDGEWDAGDTLITNGTASFSGTTASFSSLSEAITTSPSYYLVTYDIAVSPGVGDTLNGAVTAATVSNNNPPVISDTVDATLTVASTCFVTTTTDGVAGSLRTCISWANSNAGTDTIIIPSGTYTLTVTGAAEDANVSGDLDITESLNLVGAGMTATVIDGNAGVLNERAIHITAGDVSLTDLTVQNANSGTAIGAGIYSNGNSLTLNRVIVKNNTTTGNGGGLYIEVPLTMTDVELSGNTAGGGGGGVYSLGAPITWTRGTASGNSAGTDGGGIRIADILVLTNVTFSGNSASTSGASIQTGGGGASATLTNVTMYENSAVETYRLNGGTSIWKNVIVVNTGSGATCNQPSTTNGGNLETFSNACGLSDPTDQVSVSLANLNIDAALSDNGGYTKTHALNAGSFAVDAAISANCPATDQRGESRGYDGNGTPDNPQFGDCDIGAYELNNPASFIDEGTAPADKLVQADQTNQAVNAFVLKTNTGSDTLTGLTITFSGSDVNDVAASGVKIYKDENGDSEWDAGDTLITNGTASFSGTTATFTGLSEGFNSTAAQYLITYNIASAATPGNILQGAVTAATSSVNNPPVILDAADATLTVRCIVNTFADSGSGSLRNCIVWANGNPGADTITLQAGTYTVDNSASGTINITEDLTLNGAGMTSTVIDATGLNSSIFYVDPAVTNINMTDLTMQNGSGGSGGGIYFTPGNVSTLTRVAIKGNHGTASGGGVIGVSATLSFTDVEISGNTTDIQGAGIYLQGSNLTWNRGTLSGNTATGTGGGIRTTSGGGVDLTNVTISGNATNGGNAGAAFYSDGGTHTMTHVTITEHSTGANTVYHATDSLTVNNSIVSNSITNCNAAVTTSGGGNLEINTNTCGFNDATDQNSVSVANLNINATLADNGGYTKTHALNSGSFAIDAAVSSNCPATDQRGETRGYDGNGTPDDPQTGDCDIGAYEKTTTPETTIVGDGVSPANKSVFGSDTNKAVNAFTLSATGGTDTLTALTVTFSGTDVSDVAASGVKIYKDVNNDSEWDAGDTLLTNGTASFTGTTATFTGLSESINTTSTQYIVTYDMVASPGDGNVLQGSVTAVTTGNTSSILDSVDALLMAGGVCIPDTFSDDPASGFTLRECIDWANSSAGADVITLSAGTYKITRSGVDDTNVNGDFDILDDLTINGAGMASTTIEGIGVDGDHIMDIDSTVINFTVSNLRFYNGSYTSFSGGCLYSASASHGITISNVEFDTCKAGRGGAFNALSDAVTISGSVFKNNIAEDSSGFISGGAVYLIHCAQIDNTTFIDNSVLSTGAATALRGGALYMSCSFGDGAFTLSNLTFKGNSLSGSGEGLGGAAYLAGGGDMGDLLTVADSTFGSGVVAEGNASTTHGGALYHAGGPVIVTSSTFQNNIAADSGGAIYSTGSHLTIDNASGTASSFTENTANGTNIVSAGSEESGGGAIFAQDVILNIDDTTISNNNSAHWGGGVALAPSTLAAVILTLTNSTISGNQSGDLGGGLLSVGSVVIDNTSVTGNTSLAMGGAGLAAINAAKTTDITKTTFSDNNAISDGGAILAYGSVRLANTTISGNSATVDGGGLHIQGCELRNVTFYGNTSATNDSIYSGAACSDIYNTIIDNGASGNNNCNATVTPTSSNNNIENKDTCGLADATDQTTTDPQLNALADNGGSTWTHSFADGTPAVNNGDNTVCAESTIYASVDGVDQRGVARPIGGTCDIGAFESAYTASTIDIFGSCKQFDETIDCTDTGTIRIAVNSVLKAETQATVAGTWTISGVTAPSSGDVITVYIEGAADANEAVAVTKYDGFGNISGIQLMEEHLTIGSNDNQTLTNTDLGQYDNSVSGSEDIFHDVNTGALTADSTGSLTNEEIFIIIGNTFSPGGTVTTRNVQNEGTLDLTGVTNFNVSGDWTNNGSFTEDSSTVILDGGDQTITGSTTFYNLSKADTTNDATDLTLTFDNTATQTIKGTLTLDGLDSDDRINLVSDSPGTQWSINLAATATKAIDFVDVIDSDASGSDATLIPVNPADSVDSGNNIDWFSLPLVKVVYRGDTCIASSDGDAACNGGATTSPVLTGEKISFVIYISNPGASVYSDARFQDSIDDAGPDYFEFQPDSYGAGQGIKWATSGSGSSSKADIKTAINGGTELTNAFDGSTGTNEYCGIATAVSPDVLKCGGDAGSPDNDQINIGADDTFIIMFDVIKRD